MPLADRSCAGAAAQLVLNFVPDAAAALREMQRVSGGANYLVVDSYRSEREKVNLFYWQLTCMCFYTPTEWQWLFEQAGYTGFHEVEIFSALDWWQRDPDEVLRTCKERHQKVC